ncbi:hypothetical protein PIB30_065590, partial [Stylosanthes scabra]|nr:hypothetical protein [Stylosanthes scabra]
MEERWGTWLKAEHTGWRMIEQKENSNPNMPKIEQSLREQSHRPTPVNLLKGFANLSIQDDSGKNYVEECLSTGRIGGSRRKEEIRDTAQQERLVLAYCTNSPLEATNPQGTAGGLVLAWKNDVGIEVVNHESLFTHWKWEYW